MTEISKEIIGVATLIHLNECHFNHVDQCGWSYEDWENLPDRHSDKLRFYNKAKRLIDRFGLKETKDFLEFYYEDKT